MATLLNVSFSCIVCTRLLTRMNTSPIRHTSPSLTQYIAVSHTTITWLTSAPCTRYYALTKRSRCHSHMLTRRIYTRTHRTRSHSHHTADYLFFCQWHQFRPRLTSCRRRTLPKYKTTNVLFIEANTTLTRRYKKTWSESRPQNPFTHEPDPLTCQCYNHANTLFIHLARSLFVQSG